MSHLPYDDLSDTLLPKIPRKNEELTRTPPAPDEKKEEHPSTSPIFPGHLAARGM